MAIIDASGSYSEQPDFSAAVRLLALPLTSLLDQLVGKGIISIDEACAHLQVRDSAEICGNLSKAAYGVLERQEESLRAMQSIPKFVSPKV